MDALFEYELPFECYFNACVDHDEEIHDELEFIWLLEGHVSICCEGKNYELIPDHVFIIYINQKHAMKSSGETISFSFRFKKSYLKSLHLYFDRLPFKNRIFTFDELAHKYHEVPLIMSQLIILMKSSDSVANTRYRLIGYFNMYLFDLYSVRLKEKYLDQKKKNYDLYLIRFYKIDTYINRFYYKKITLDELAKLVEISPHRVSHFIKEILGISFQEYLSNVRLGKALEELKNTDKSIQEVVKNCGFSDQKYLNAIMKDKFHITALKYRKIMKDDVNFGVEGFNYSHMLQELTQKLHKIHDESSSQDTYGLKMNVLESQK